jgi:hypothetical protein
MRRFHRQRFYRRGFWGYGRPFRPYRPRPFVHRRPYMPLGWGLGLLLVPVVWLIGMALFSLFRFL